MRPKYFEQVQAMIDQSWFPKDIAGRLFGQTGLLT
jgi:hypothetical protein